eukprot:3512260-Alexandrium_andersonii.AAC.1
MDTRFKAIEKKIEKMNQELSTELKNAVQVITSSSRPAKDWRQQHAVMIASGPRECTTADWGGVGQFRALSCRFGPFQARSGASGSAPKGSEVPACA